MKELDEIAKRNPFRTPDGYFESLSDRMVSAALESEPKIVQASLLSRLRPYLLAAATVALLAIAGYMIFSPSAKDNAGIKHDAVADFYSGNTWLDDIDTGTLEDNVSASGTLGDKLPDVPKSEIINYLVSEDVNILEIYELL